ncbi:MAG: hypothetical protein GY730_11735 [bacterium]|nr:hypothetical protein [bacterium]
MSIENLGHSYDHRAGHKSNLAQQKAGADKVSFEKSKFDAVLNDVAKAVLPAEKMDKQRLFKDKKIIENGRGIQSEEEDDYDSIVKKVRELEKKINEIAEYKRKKLGL